MSVIYFYGLFSLVNYRLIVSQTHRTLIRGVHNYRVEIVYLFRMILKTSGMYFAMLLEMKHETIKKQKKKYTGNNLLVVLTK